MFSEVCVDYIYICLYSKKEERERESIHEGIQQSIFCAYNFMNTFDMHVQSSGTTQKKGLHVSFLDHPAGTKSQ